MYERIHLNQKIDGGVFFLNYKENELMWRERVADFNSSGLTKVEWCANNNLKVTALRYWVNKLRDAEKSNNAQEWYQLEIAENKPNNAVDNTIVVHIGNFKVEVAEGFDKTVFISTVRALQEIC
ncbi:MAG: hypothetical protein WC967_16330 [Balneolaceae bacterium]